VKGGDHQVDHVCFIRARKGNSRARERRAHSPYASHGRGSVPLGGRTAAGARRRPLTRYRGGENFLVGRTECRTPGHSPDGAPRPAGARCWPAVSRGGRNEPGKGVKRQRFTRASQEIGSAPGAREYAPQGSAGAGAAQVNFSYRLPAARAQGGQGAAVPGLADCPGAPPP
jgi:hypothetical protein